MLGADQREEVPRPERHDHAVDLGVVLDGDEDGIEGVVGATALERCERLLGASHVRVFAGQTKELSREEADKLVITALEECSDYAGQKGIFLGIENHDAIGSAEHLLKLIKQVNSRWLGVNLDSGNFRTADPYADFAECAPYAVNVQLKTEINPVGGKGPQPADLGKFVKLP